jgi:hypothetical protein
MALAAIASEAMAAFSSMGEVRQVRLGGLSARMRTPILGLREFGEIGSISGVIC